MTVTPSGNAFLQSHIDRVYQLNPLSSWILTIAILKASLSPVNQEHLRNMWENFNSKGETLEQQQEREKLMRQFLNWESSQDREDTLFRNPYIDSLALRDIFGLLEDPHYQSVLTLRMSSRKKINGFLSYKQGDSRIQDGHFYLENAYIFFETYTRVYVFQVRPLNNLSANILVFQKKPSQTHLMADDLYYGYFQGLRSYFRSSFLEVDTDLVTLILDHLTMITVTERASNFLDRLIYRLTDVQQAFNLPSRSTIYSVVTQYEGWDSDGQADFQIPTLLKIARYLGVDLSILLSDVDLRPYVQLDPNRSPLSEVYILEVERTIRRRLRGAIRESGLTLLDIANQTGINQKTFGQVITRWTAKYLNLEKITTFLGIDTNRFLVEIANEVSRHVSPSSLVERDEQNPDEASLEFIGNRIKQAMSLAEFLYLKKEIKRRLGIHIDTLGQTNPTFAVLLRASYTTHVSLSLLVSEENLEEHISPHTVRQTKLPEDYIEKARQLVIYYIKRRMVKLNISLIDLASSSHLQEVTLRAWFNHRGSPMYLSLVKIADGLEISLPELLKDLETDIARFESLDLHVEIPEPRANNMTENTFNEFQRWKQRMIQALELTNISSNTLQEKFNIELHRLRDRESIQLRTIFKVAHVAGISVSSLLGNSDLSQFINPDRYKDTINPLSVQRIDRKMRRLSQNIQNHAEGASERELNSRSRIYLRRITTRQSQYFPAFYILQLAEDMNVRPTRFFQGL